MHWNEHWDLEGRHAFLSPSQYHWVNYSLEKLDDRYSSAMAKERGTRLHALASECIKLGVRLVHNKNALNMFVNDAIGFKMESEQPLYYSDFCFGTADAISFRRNQLRIHDLKTGQTPTSMSQLEIYAALFCLEYGYSPFDIGIVLRIYQGTEIAEKEPEPEAIKELMDKIVQFDAHLTELTSV